jgi:hypothetical protein
MQIEFFLCTFFFFQRNVKHPVPSNVSIFKFKKKIDSSQKNTKSKQKQLSEEELTKKN